jgi:hypothetical protein
MNWSEMTTPEFIGWILMISLVAIGLLRLAYVEGK